MKALTEREMTEYIQYSQRGEKHPLIELNPKASISEVFRKTGFGQLELFVMALKTLGVEE